VKMRPKIAAKNTSILQSHSIAKPAPAGAAVGKLRPSATVLAAT
jgi:hypothetical protein